MRLTDLKSSSAGPATENPRCHALTVPVSSPSLQTATPQSCVHPAPAVVWRRSAGSSHPSSPSTRPAPDTAKQNCGSVSSGQIQYHSPGTL